MQLFLIFIVSLIVLLSFSVYNLNKTKEGFANDQEFIQNQEKYYNSRDNASLLVDSDSQKFYKFDSGKPMGQQLTIETPGGSSSSSGQSNVDIQVQK